MNWGQLLEQFTIRGIIRNMILYEFARSLLLIICHRAWPDYSAILVDLVAVFGANLDDEESRSWPRFIFAAVIVEGIRYLVGR